MDLFGRLLDLSLENNAFPAALMDLFQKNSSRLIKLIVTARPKLSWHYGIGTFQANFFFFGVHYIILGAHFFSFHLAFCKKH
jgi:hypothetical protein